VGCLRLHAQEHASPTSIIHPMDRGPSARHYMYSALLLMLMGWGGLALMILVFNLPPLVWARWGFFALWFIALSGTALPITFYLNLRFPSDPAAEPSSIVRQAVWVGVYGCIVAWLQLGHVMAFWVWIGLAGGLMAVEYLVRLRERSQWHPPSDLENSYPPGGVESQLPEGDDPP
jgi:hypothetical protein